MPSISRRARLIFEEHGAIGTLLLCLKAPLSPLLRSSLGTRLRRAYHGWTFDRKFNVDTSGFIVHPTPSVAGGIAELGRPYDGTNPSHFKRIIRGLDVRYEDFSFVDFGSGKGRALLLASAFPFRSVTGVEWDGGLHAIAQRNLDGYTGPRACTQARSFCGDAGEFPIPDGNSVLYFFNPFKDAVMARVLENIKRSLETQPKEIVIVYVNPKCREIFDRAQFLERTVDRGWFAVYRTLPPRNESQGLSPASAGSTVLSEPAA